MDVRRRPKKGHATRRGTRQGTALGSTIENRNPSKSIQWGSAIWMTWSTEKRNPLWAAYETWRPPSIIFRWRRSSLQAGEGGSDRVKWPGRLKSLQGRKGRRQRDPYPTWPVVTHAQSHTPRSVSFAKKVRGSELAHALRITRRNGETCTSLFFYKRENHLSGGLSRGPLLRHNESDFWARGND